MSGVANPATVENCLRMGAGFTQGDRVWIAEQFGPLDVRLASFEADATELEISVKDRQSPGQKVTLECWTPGLDKIVTTSTEGDLHAAVMDVRDDLRRRLTDAKGRRSPR
jgi:ribosome-associated translation inhibitor RaiA